MFAFSDWDGVNYYEQVRTTLVAKEWGYVAFAADIYGAQYHEVDEMSERIRLATLYRSDPELFIGRIQAAM
jgi:dienelactone hydrolase